MKINIRMIRGLAVTLLLTGLLIWWIFPPGYQIEDNVKVYRVGMIIASDLQLETIEGFREAMVGLGYNEGVNIVYYIQNPKGDRELTKKLAKDLAAKDLDLYVSFSTTATKAMQDAQTGAKIVFGDVGDYRELGLESIRKPGKNITGVTTGKVELSGKRMEILKEAVPNARVFGIIWNPSRANFNQIKKLNEEAARDLNISLVVAKGTTEEEIFTSIQTKIKHGEVDGVITTTDSIISGQKEKIAQYLRKEKIPSIDANLEGGSGYLISHAPSRKEIGEQTAVIVDKFFKGARLDNMPVEFPRMVELHLNATMAKEIGIELPPGLLEQATFIKR
jgi:putative ABC transport system substrate-binding protein